MLEKLLSNLVIENQNVAQYNFKPEYQALANSPKNIDFQTLCSQ